MFPFRELRSVPGGERIRTLDGHKVAVGSLQFSPDGRHLWSLGYEAVLNVRSVDGWALERKSGPITAMPFAFALSYDASLVGLTLDHGVTVLSADTFQTLATEKTGGGQTQYLSCTTGMAIDTYGGSADLWGLTWTAAELNAGNFTVRIRNADGVDFNVYVNWIRVTVTSSTASSTAEYAGAVGTNDFTAYGDAVGVVR